MNSLVTSYIRTYVPIGVGMIVAYLVTLGIQLDNDTQAALVVFLTGALQALYYAVARTLEKKWPQLGSFLLGSSKQPTYREVK